MTLIFRKVRSVKSIFFSTSLLPTHWSRPSFMTLFMISRSQDNLWHFVSLLLFASGAGWHPIQPTQDLPASNVSRKRDVRTYHEFCYFVVGWTILSLSMNRYLSRLPSELIFAFKYLVYIPVIVTEIHQNIFMAMLVFFDICIKHSGLSNLLALSNSLLQYSYIKYIQGGPF